jgi:hypothetical protein
VKLIFNLEINNHVRKIKYYSGYEIKEGWDGRGTSQELERREMNIIFWLENLKGRDHFEDIGLDGQIILERILRM